MLFETIGLGCNGGAVSAHNYLYIFSYILNPAQDEFHAVTDMV